MTTPLIPVTGREDRREILLPDTLEMEVCTVEGKNPAKRGSAVNAISAILSISILLLFYRPFECMKIQRVLVD